MQTPMKAEKPRKQAISGHFWADRTYRGRIKDDHKIDLGCGSGRDSKHFIEKGFRVVPVDGSPEMCKFAESYLGSPVRCLQFSKLDYKKESDGIWACASLLHVPKQNLDAVMQRVERA